MKQNYRPHFTVTLIHRLLWVLFFIALGFVTQEFSAGDTSIRMFPLAVGEIRTTFSLRVDALSSLLLLMATLLGAVIGNYALRYLSGEKRQAYFYHYLLLTLLSVCLLLLSNNLIMFYLMWLLSGLGLHKLLLYAPERPRAQAAAWKKFLVSRLGDLALLFAIGLTYRHFGTFDFSELFRAAQAIPVDSSQAQGLSLIGLLFVIGAMTKSAQFPFHFWLPETMETPAPVSALMHAGVINAGGFLIIRLSPILQHAVLAHFTLTFFGALTALFGALAMITQNDIKKKLAYSRSVRWES